MPNLDLNDLIFLGACAILAGCKNDDDQTVKYSVHKAKKVWEEVLKQESDKEIK
jgi:hypothetical protein